jgi:uncharacterized RDD family membrane protein YckC
VNSTASAGRAVAPSACRPAGIVRRLGALAYEALLLAALVFFAGFMLLPLVTPGRAPGASSLALPELPARVIIFCGVFAVAAAYFTWSWTAGRRTLAQKTWRVRIVDDAGRPPVYRRALVRYVAGWIGPALALVVFATARPYGLGGIAVVALTLNYLAACVDPEHAFLHDRIAGTRIVDDAAVPG